MIEIKEYQGEPHLVVNQVVRGGNKINLENYPHEMFFNVIDEEVFSEIKRIPFNKFNIGYKSNNKIMIQFTSLLDISGIKHTVNLYAYGEPGKRVFDLAVNFSFEFEKWKNPFSAEDLLFEFKKVVNQKYDIEMKFIIDDGYEIRFICDHKQNIENYLYIVNRITRNAIN